MLRVLILPKLCVGLILDDLLKEKLLNLGNYYFPQIYKKVKPNINMNRSLCIKQVSKINQKF